MCEVIWQCQICKTENRDLTDETATPICARCDIEHDWSDLTVDNLALFEVDDDGEATGIVYHFCSESCRIASHKSLGNNLFFGGSNGACEDETCAKCGNPL